MPVTRIACSVCGGGLTFGAPPPAGTRLQCPRCHTLITLNGDSPRAPATSPDHRSDVPGGSNGILILMLAVAGFLIVLGVGVGLTAYLTRGKQNPPVADAVAGSSLESPVPDADVKPPRLDSAAPVNRPPAPAEPLPPAPPPYRPGPFEPPGAAPPPSLALSVLPEAEQKQVHQAIDRGVSFLRATQTSSGGWQGSAHPVGYTALPGLTLLECGVPATDPAVRKAAESVRAAIPRLQKTYELALAVLFLDRLGDPADRGLIQTLALRLVAGQYGDGGWGYDCRVLDPKDHDLLLAALRKARPQSALELFVPDGPRGSFTPIDRPPAIGEDFLPGILQRPPAGSTPELKPAPPPPAKKPDPKKPNTGSLPPALQDLPGLPDNLDLKALPGRSDNSNTQFAALALWTARRHDVPMERTLAQLERRFRLGQNPDGSWGYSSGPGTRDATRPHTMTCAGLLGLALGHGVLQELQARSQAVGLSASVTANVQDPGLLKGIEYLSRYVGEPSDDGRAGRLENLYFLWSLERVGVLFNLKTIHGKDWYRWGAQMLIANQNGNGSWHGTRYPGSGLVVDTCFALLFLKRVNLARDLTEKLEFLTPAPSP